MNKILAASPLAILTIVLLEGFVTISAQILTMRQMQPFVGNSVVVISLIIGVFLLFLAYGYRAGGLVKARYAEILRRNFILSSLLIAVGLSYVFLLSFFTLLNPRFSFISILLIYLMLITAPLVYLLGQTVPITMHLLQGEDYVKTGALGGQILHLSTVGSFLGAVLTSILLMQFLGVAWTVVINVAVLALLCFLLTGRKSAGFIGNWSVAILVVAAYFINVAFEQKHFLFTNHYGNYRIIDTQVGDTHYRELEINHSRSSMLDSHGQSYPYIEAIKKILFDDRQLKDKDILVLGAGAFTLSVDQHGNNFTYVDIDNKLDAIASEYFIRDDNMQFFAQDARAFLQQNLQKYDVIVLDVYYHMNTIPQHLLTQEFFTLIQARLNPQGFAVFNMIINPAFTDAYSQAIDNTLRQAFAYCLASPHVNNDALTNVIYTCQGASHQKNTATYTDDLNKASLHVFQLM